MMVRVQGAISGLVGRYSVRLSVLDANGFEVLAKQSDPVDVPPMTETLAITELRVGVATQQAKPPVAPVA